MKECLTPAMIRQKLMSMPEDLDQTYHTILSRIPPHQHSFIRSALYWLALSTRPLLLEELAEAAVINPELGVFDGETSRLLNNRMIVDLCGVLVSVETVKENKMEWLRIKGTVENRYSRNFYHKEEVVVVALSHYSVKEYMLRAQSDPSSDIALFRTSETLGNSFIAQCCLIYLLDFNDGNIASPLERLDFERNPLLQYAACYWMDHWGLAGEEHDQAPLRPLYERLFAPDCTGAYINWLNIWDPDSRWMSNSRFGRRSDVQSADLHTQPLYWAATLGDPALVKILVERGGDLKAREGHFESAFGAAAFAGHTAVMSYFLERGADPNMPGKKFANLLQIAVLGGSRSAGMCILRLTLSTSLCPCPPNCGGYILEPETRSKAR